MTFGNENTDELFEQNNTGHAKDASRTSGNGPPPSGDVEEFERIRLELRERYETVYELCFKDGEVDQAQRDAIDEALACLADLDTFVAENRTWVERLCTAYLDEVGINEGGLAHWNFIKWLVLDIEYLLKGPALVTARRVGRCRSLGAKLNRLRGDLFKCIETLDDLADYVAAA